MNRLYLLSWYYQGQDGESDAHAFFGKLREGLEKGKKFPFDCPSEVGLVHCAVDEHWCVGVLVMRGTEGDDSVEQTNRLHQWFEACDADFSGTDRTGERVTHPSVEGTLQSRYGSHYTCVEVFDPLSIAPEDKNSGIESKPLSMDNLNPEDKAMAADLISLGDDDPDVRYKAYNVLDQKRYRDDALLSGISRIEAEIPSDDVATRVRLYCGLGVWLGGNIYTRPKGIELIKHAIELSTDLALPHALVGTLLMGDSSNLYLERGTSSFRQHPELSDGELELLSKQFHTQAQEELELAIRLNPNDPTPYYVFCNSQFLDFSQLKNQYLQGVQRDKTRSPEFGGKHWSFAIKAAKFNQASDATVAFLRAMIAEPEEYYEGPKSVRPKDGLALSCWQTAKQQIASYQGDAGRLDELWQVGQANVPLSQPVKETMAEAESPQSFQERLTPQEWETLQSVFIWVFRMTFGIIRKSDCLKLDEKTMAVMGMVIARAPELENDLAREVLLSLAGNFESIWMRCLDDPRLPHEALEPVAQLLQDKVSPEDARGFKQAVLIMTRVVAEASGRTGQEAAAVVMPATILYPGASTDEILSEVGMTTSRSIYKRQSVSSTGQAVAQTPSGPASSPGMTPVVTATPGAGQAETSPALNAVIQKYMSKQYTLVSRTGTSAVLKRQAPVNWGIFILLGRCAR